MSLLLQQDELIELTGRKNRSSQIQWLQEHGIPSFINAKGFPVVSRSCIEKLLGGMASRDTDGISGPAPDFEALKDE
jgi:hypothetical protein